MRLGGRWGAWGDVTVSCGQVTLDLKVTGAAVVTEWTHAQAGTTWGRCKTQTQD